VQAVAVPAAVGAVAKLAAEVNAEPEVARVAIERAADSAAQLSEGVAAPKTLENAAEIGAAAAGVAVEQVLGEQNPGLFVAAAADGAGKTIVFCFGCLFSFRFCSANVAVPKITPGEPPKDFVKDELAREQIASVAVEKVAAEQLVNEGLDAQSVAKGVQSGVKLAAEDVERKAMKVAEVKRGKDKKDFFEKKKKKQKSMPMLLLLLALPPMLLVPLLKGSLLLREPRPKRLARLATRPLPPPLTLLPLWTRFFLVLFCISFVFMFCLQPMDGASRAAVAAAAAGVASTQVLGEKDPVVFEAVASKAAADEVVPKDPSAKDFASKEERREEAAFVGTATVVAQAMKGEMSNERAEEDAKSAGLVAAAEVRKDAAKEVAVAGFEKVFFLFFVLK
jgi:Na+-translocating ferredoxin:NAD+ oxidoreductase RnfG subunit